jgi:hypothetical protein
LSSNFFHHLETKAKSLIPYRIPVYLLLLCALLGIFSLELPAAAETTLTGTVPLVTDSIAVSHISSTAAVISWATNGKATSQVFFDTVSHDSFVDYRFSSPLHPAPVLDHEVSLQDLSPLQTYRFRVVSSSENLTAISTENSFSTLSAAENNVPGNGFGGQIGATIIGPGVTDLSLYTNNLGVFNLDAVAASNNNSVVISIPRGVRGETSDGGPLKSISIIPVTTPPPFTPGISVIGLLYELGPDGATFDPAVTLTFSYSPENLPAGISQENLAVAVWDSLDDRWEMLSGVVDPTSHTIVVSVTHFSQYAILARHRPASFTVGDLTIKPDPVVFGQTVHVSVFVANSGDLSGNYRILLKINDAEVAVRDVVLRGGADQNVTFSYVLDSVGDCALDINGLNGTITVIAPDSPQLPPAEVEEQTAGSEVISPYSPLAKAIGWFIGAGIIALGATFIMFIAMLTKRRKSGRSSDFEDHS